METTADGLCELKAVAPGYNFIPELLVSLDLDNTKVKL